MSAKQCATTFCYVAPLSACCQHLDATVANMPFWGCFFSSARTQWHSTRIDVVLMAILHVRTLVLGIREVHKAPFAWDEFFGCAECAFHSLSHGTHAQALHFLWVPE